MAKNLKKKRAEIEELMIKQLREMDREFKLPEIEQGLKAKEYKKRLRGK